MRLQSWSLAFALGITMGIGIFLLGFISWLCQGQWGDQIVHIISSAYVGYSSTFWGSVIGGIWAFIDWFIGGLIFVWIYNAFVSGD